MANVEKVRAGDDLLIPVKVIATNLDPDGPWRLRVRIGATIFNLAKSDIEAAAHIFETSRVCVEDLLYQAWAVIANAGEGNWQENETAEWVTAAKRWRDAYHAHLDSLVSKDVDNKNIETV